MVPFRKKPEKKEIKKDILLVSYLPDNQRKLKLWI